MMLVFLFHRRPSLYLLAVYLHGMTSHAVDTFLLFRLALAFWGKQRQRGLEVAVGQSSSRRKQPGKVLFVQSGSLSDDRGRCSMAACFRCRVDARFLIFVPYRQFNQKFIIALPVRGHIM